MELRINKNIKDIIRGYISRYPTLTSQRFLELLKRSSYYYHLLFPSIPNQEQLAEFSLEFEKIRKQINLEHLAFNACAKAIAQTIPLPYEIDERKHILKIKISYHRCFLIKLDNPAVCADLKNNPDKIKNVIDALSQIGNTYCNVVNYGNNVQWKTDNK